jgi:DNA modification methylase
MKSETGMAALPVNQILQGDALIRLKEFPDQRFHCCVTSPPYWGLRDYGASGQMGSEKSPEEFIEKMVVVFREVRRVLRNDGTLWVNIGDTYNAYKANTGDTKYAGKAGRPVHAKGLTVPALKSKDLIGIPWMLAFALRADGWYLRQDIIWHKPNPMPESVNDRCTKAHEYFFLFSKSKNYYFDAYSIATDYKDKTLTTFGCELIGSGDGSKLIQSENWARDIKVHKPKEWKTPDGCPTRPGSHGSFHSEGREKGKKAKSKTLREESAQRDEVNGRGFIGHSGNFDAEGKLIGSGKANKRSVWTVATAPFKEAHFATFPSELIVDCVKAGCPPGGIVLDPFIGAGTTGLVARKLDRNFIGIELNPKYIAIAENRLKTELGLFP